MTNSINISDFYSEQFITHCTYDSFRSIASYVDGQKNAARKVLQVMKDQNSNLKVSSIAAKVIDSTQYLHGNMSLEGVIVGLAQTFTGTNNINLLNPDGDFGSRCIPKAGASRYIYSSKNKIFDIIFNKKDTPILIAQEFEGDKIEPRFFIPILPMLLVNGNEGIGTGFAQKILSRNPIELIKIIEKYLDNGKIPNEIKPFFKGYKGDTVKYDGGYEFRGKLNKVGQTTLEITEIPIGYDLEKYNKILTKLEETKVIQDFTDRSEPGSDKILFEVKVDRIFMAKDEEWMLNTLKLIRRVSENFTCIDENNAIVEFKSEIDILKAYIKIRLEYYIKRKAYMLEKMRNDLLILGSKYYFIKAIIDDKIVVNKRSKVQINEQIEKFTGFKFVKVNDTFDYLLNMPISSFTKEVFNDLKETIDKRKIELKELEAKTENQIWKDELNELKVELERKK